jgi:Protein of unknown function (DUF3040)
VALNMDEQRILDEMERNLAADDPRLAARLGSFGEPGEGSVRLQHARTIGGVLALALIAAVTVLMFVVSPFASHVYDPGKAPASHKPTPTTHTTTKSKTSTTSS